MVGDVYLLDLGQHDAIGVSVGYLGYRGSAPGLEGVQPLCPRINGPALFGEVVVMIVMDAGHGLRGVPQHERHHATESERGHVGGSRPAKIVWREWLDDASIMQATTLS